MPANKLLPMLSVENMQRALHFYRELLGGAESYRFPSDGSPQFLALRVGGSEIGIGEMRGATGVLHGRALRPATGHRIELCVYVDDVDDTVERMRRAGIEVAMEPADQPWGERVAYVVDPDGNLIMLTK